MPTPSTASSKDAGTTVQPAAEPEAIGRSRTHSVVKGEPAPRLPHERDESSDSGTGEPRAVMEKAADDVNDGQVDTPRGPVTQRRYSELAAEAGADADADVKPQRSGGSKRSGPG